MPTPKTNRVLCSLGFSGPIARRVKNVARRSLGVFQVNAGFLFGLAVPGGSGRRLNNSAKQRTGRSWGDRRLKFEGIAGSETGSVRPTSWFGSCHKERKLNLCLSPGGSRQATSARGTHVRQWAFFRVSGHRSRKCCVSDFAWEAVSYSEKLCLGGKASRAGFTFLLSFAAPVLHENRLDGIFFMGRAPATHDQVCRFCFPRERWPVGSTPPNLT